MKKRLNYKGFTLVELLLVLVIIGIILVLAIPGILDAIEDSRTESGKTVERILKRDLELYNEDHKEDLWISNDEQNCTYVSFSDLLTANEDIKLGECLLQNNNSLLIKKLGNNRYEYHVWVSCGKNVKNRTGNESIDDEYIISKNNGERLYYETNDESECNGIFELTADYNGGQYVSSSADWVNQGGTATKNNVQSGEPYGALPEVTREGYVFKGWNTKQNGSGAYVDENSRTTIEIRTIYAIWMKETDSTPLTFNDQTIKVTYSESAQSRDINTVTGGVGSYTFEKLPDESDPTASDITVSATGRVTIPASKQVGTYTVGAKVTDGAGSDTATITVIVSDEKVTVRCPTIQDYNGVYDKEAHSIIVKNDGFVGTGGKIEYREGENGTWSETKPTLTSVGEVTVYVRAVSGNSYYNSKDCGSKRIVITPKVLTPPTQPADKIYNGSSQQSEITCPDDTTTSGRESAINVGNYDQTCTLEANYKWSDGTTAPKTIPWKIVPKSIPVTWGTITWIYDGNPHSTTANAATGISGETMNLSISDNSITTAGTQRVVASCSSVESDSARCANYTLTNTSRTLTVNKRPITVKATDQSKSYDGTPLTADETCSVTSESLPSGHTYTCVNSGEQTAVGSSTKTLNSVTINNSGTDVSSSFEITKTNGTLTVSNSTVATLGSCANPTYNGNSQNIVRGGSHVTYANNIQTTHSSTNYAVTATPETGYTWEDGTTAPKTLNCNIARKSITLTAGSSTREYNGNELTNSSCTTGTNDLISGHSVSCTPTSTSKITNIGLVNNVIDTYTIKDSSNNPVTENYAVTTVNGTLIVTSKSLTITISNCDKEYNGNKSANCAITYNGVVSGDSVIGGATCSFADSNVGTGKTVTCSSFTKSGPGSDNYDTPSSGQTTAKIMAKQVEVTWGNLTWTFDNTTHKTSYSAASGITGETINLGIASGENSIKYSNPGTQALTVKCSSVSGGNAQCTNYSLTHTSETLRVNCDKNISGTISEGRKVTYAGKEWTVVSGTSSSSSVKLAYNGKVDADGKENGSEGGTYTDNETNVRKWIDKSPIMKDAIDSSCIENKGSKSGEDVANAPGVEHWVKSGTVYVPDDVPSYKFTTDNITKYTFGYTDPAANASAPVKDVNTSCKADAAGLITAGSYKTSVANDSTSVTYEKSVCETKTSSYYYSDAGYMRFTPSTAVGTPSSSIMPIKRLHYDNNFAIDSNATFSSIKTIEIIICGSKDYHGETYTLTAKNATQYTFSAPTGNNGTVGYSANVDYPFAGPGTNTANSTGTKRTYDMAGSSSCAQRKYKQIKSSSKKIYYRPTITVNK